MRCEARGRPSRPALGRHRCLLVDQVAARFREFDDLVEGRILALSFATVAELRAGVLIGAWGDKRRRIIEERIAQPESTVSPLHAHLTGPVNA